MPIKSKRTLTTRGQNEAEKSCPPGAELSAVGGDDETGITHYLGCEKTGEARRENGPLSGRCKPKLKRRLSRWDRTNCLRRLSIYCEENNSRLHKKCKNYLIRAYLCACSVTLFRFFFFFFGLFCSHILLACTIVCRD